MEFPGSTWTRWLRLISDAGSRSLTEAVPARWQRPGSVPYAAVVLCSHGLVWQWCKSHKMEKPALARRIVCGGVQHGSEHFPGRRLRLEDKLKKVFLKHESDLLK